MKTLLGENWWVVPTYLLGGLALGLADAQLGRWAQQLGTRPGIATAVSVNVVMPLLAIGLAVVASRLGTAWLGAVGMTGAFVLGLATVHSHGQRWDLATLLRSVPPVVVMACVGYGVLGTIAVLTTRGMEKRLDTEPSA